MNVQKSPIYTSLEERWARGQATVMDGGIGSELQAMGYPPVEGDQPQEGVNFTWGSMALYDAPEIVKAMHRRYVDAGADILLTDTFLFHRCVVLEEDGVFGVPPKTWHEKARLAVRLAREAAAEGGRPETAVVFCMMIHDEPKEEWVYNGPSYERGTKDWDQMVPLDYLRELTAVLNEDPATRPDALLVELAPPISGDLSFPHYQVMIESGIPLWVAYRRNASGPVGIFGEEQESDGDLFGRAARRFEEIGVQAVLVHCLPAEKAHGVAPWLRQFTSLPLGVYPNNGRYDMWVWKWEHDHTAEELAEHARGYASEGMSIIGGCCGTRPEHIAAIAEAVGSASVT
jgi:S-methylmethionine-dependent homocysteine/selenocysteine methylase